jgi:hypothetical protein
MKTIQTHKFGTFKTLGSVVLVAVILAFTSGSLLALTTLNVTINSDNKPGEIGEVGDLRYALNSMNQGLNTTQDDYAIVFSNPMTIQLNGILPIINNSANAVNITIGNSDPTSIVIIDGNSGAYPGFFIAMGNVTIQNMTFQSMTAKGGNGGNGISGGGGGLGAGGAIYAPQSFLYGSNPSIVLINVSINGCSAVGGNGGSYFSLSSTGNEGGGGGGGFSGNGGSITTTGSTGGAGGGGFGGNGGDVTLSADDVLGGGGGGGGGLGSRATTGTLTNLGNGGSDQDAGQNGNGFGLTITAGSGGGGKSGGNQAGGAGGGGAIEEFTLSGGGGGGSAGSDGTQPQGSTPPWDGSIRPAGLSRHSFQVTAKLANHGKTPGYGAARLANYGPVPNGGSAVPSGGNGGDGGGGGGGGIVITSFTNGVDGQAASGGYGGGGGGGAGVGAYDPTYTVRGGSGGVGGGGGGGGVNESDETPAEGGNSLGGGGGGGAGPSSDSSALGGTDTGNLGAGSGGAGANTFGSGSGGGGGGGGSGLGGAIFVDSGLSLIVKAIPGVPTIFNTSNNTTQPGNHGTGGPGGSDGTDGSPFGDSIFLRAGSSVTFLAQDTDDLLTLGEQVGFADDTVFNAGGTSVLVTGNGTVIYNGTTGYQGVVKVNNANFKVNGEIDAASIFVCRNLSLSSQRGTLSGVGKLTGDVFVNSGTIFPDTGATLTLGSLALNPADPASNTLGSLVRIGIDSNSAPSVVAVTGAATLAGTLQIDLDSNAQPGSYIILTSSGITGTFDSVTFTGATPNYSLSYLPAGAPTYVQFDLLAPFPPPTPERQMVNLSSRAEVGTGDNVTIAGFIIHSDPSNRSFPSGTAAPTKKVLLRGIGPSLAAYNIAGTLQDPVLDLYDGNGALIESNDDWATSPGAAEIISRGLAPSDPHESAILRTLDADANYTAILSGKNSTTGVGLVEAYDMDASSNTHLVNVSARAFVDTGDHVLIGGLIVKGDAAADIIVRALGPSLMSHGITNALADPILELHDGNGELLETNDNWMDSPRKDDIIAAGLAPGDEHESAMYITPVPGNYTGIVRGVSDGTGVALIEMYRFPSSAQ